MVDMQYQSALDLKQELKAQLLPELLKNLPTLPNFGFSSRRIEAIPSALRSLALGISKEQGQDFKLAVRIQHRSLQNSPFLQTLIDRARGEVDVKYVGRISSRSTFGTTRTRPLKIGVSVGHFNITAGTLGCFVMNGNGEVGILSNNHVLADENAGQQGDAILQAGHADGGTNPDDVVAELEDFVELSTEGSNFVDCAWAKLSEEQEFDHQTITGHGSFSGGSDSAEIHMDVQKLGRTTGFRRGRITAVEMDNVVVGYGIGDLVFDNQIEVEGAGDLSFSDGGDSGSLIMGSNFNAVGLLFAGGDQGGTNGMGLTYANPIDSVLQALDVSFAS